MSKSLLFWKGVVCLTKILLRDYQGKIIGRIEVSPNGKKTLIDFYGKILGTYDPKTNITKDFYGYIVGRGDCLTMLLKN